LAALKSCKRRSTQFEEYNGGSNVA
jgi:hypothetical protein